MVVLGGEFSVGGTASAPVVFAGTVFIGGRASLALTYQYLYATAGSTFTTAGELVLGGPARFDGPVTCAAGGSLELRYFYFYPPPGITQLVIEAGCIQVRMTSASPLAVGSTVTVPWNTTFAIDSSYSDSFNLNFVNHGTVRLSYVSSYTGTITNYGSFSMQVSSGSVTIYGVGADNTITIQGFGMVVTIYTGGGTLVLNNFGFSSSAPSYIYTDTGTRLQGLIDLPNFVTLVILGYTETNM